MNQGVQGKCIATPTRTTPFSKEKGAALGGTRTHDTLLYTSHIAVVEFVEALGTWVEESLLKRLKNSIMADECTNVTTVEELSVFCRWEEDGLPVEHFLEIVLAVAQIEHGVQSSSFEPEHQIFYPRMWLLRQIPSPRSFPPEDFSFFQ